VRRLLWFGFRDEPGLDHFILNGFFVQECVAVVAVTLLAVARLLHTDRRPFGPLELCGWLWLAITLGFNGMQSYQPDRRWLLAAPPLAILIGLAAVERAHFRAEPGRAPHIGARRWLAAWGLLGLLIALYLRPALLVTIQKATEHWQLGSTPGFSNRTLLLLLWTAAFAVAAALVFAIRRWRLWRRAALPGVTLLVVVLAVDVARIGHAAGQVQFTIRDTGRRIGAMVDSLPPERRAIVGNTADSFALDHRMFAFVIRRWKNVGMYMNRDGLTRFKPGLAIVTERRDHLLGDEGFDFDDMHPLREYEYWPDAHGRPRLTTTVYDPAGVPDEDDDADAPRRE